MRNSDEELGRLIAAIDWRAKPFQQEIIGFGESTLAKILGPASVFKKVSGAAQSGIEAAYSFLLSQFGFKQIFTLAEIAPMIYRNRTCGWTTAFAFRPRFLHSPVRLSSSQRFVSAAEGTSMDDMNNEIRATLFALQQLAAYALVLADHKSATRNGSLNDLRDAFIAQFQWSMDQGQPLPQETAQIAARYSVAYEQAIELIFSMAEGFAR
ncbi:hypothetical protein [Paraburkholderia sp. SG-MS1]|uniref:hypothetical protein n=1 Tax=Paraburkholderia sp. SG-MS1 TaxID=2023741 RepID=UPI001445A541|nr:hypothetical protein [Paraburkholderia sp. SG-MS1]